MQKDLGGNDLSAFYTVCTEDPAKGGLAIPNYVYASLVQHTTSAPNAVWIAAGKVSRFSAPGLDFGSINALIGTSGVFAP